jgi:hypothetical protein
MLAGVVMHARVFLALAAALPIGLAAAVERGDAKRCAEIPSRVNRRSIVSYGVGQPLRVEAPMDLFSSVILAIVATGGVLVLGGIFLIASGALKLAGDKSGKTDLKIGDFFQMGTTVPGLGIFMLGLAFEFVGLYYANEARRDDVAGQISSAVKKERDDHALRLAGIVQMNSDQDVRLSVCMGQQIVVRSNNPFDSTIGPYLDFVVVRLETEGVRPQLFTIARTDHLPPSFKTFSHLVQPQNGLADMGQVSLDQVVDLTSAIRGKQLPVLLEPTTPIPAGAAYGPVN